MSESADLVLAVNQELDHALSGVAEQLALVGEEAEAMGEAVASLASGGKRMRALLCYWGWRGAGGATVGAPGFAAVRCAAAALELFQMAALIHDDIIDRSDTRRGQPSVHQRFTALHRSGGWAGGAEHFGTSAGILTGDLCLAASEECFASSLPHLLQAHDGGADATEALRRFATARSTFSAMHTEVMAGQYLDLLSEVSAGAKSPQQLIDVALRVIRFKAARYSTEHPLRIGGALAGGSAGLLDGYGAFALPLGEAFQLRDDLLGVFGDPAVTGKPAGDDLKEGKRTVLIGYALRDAAPAAAQRISEALGNPQLTDDDVRELRELITASGAPTVVEALIGTLSATATENLRSLRLAEDVKGELGRLARAAVARSS